jgi:hypothetical protein
MAVDDPAVDHPAVDDPAVDDPAVSDRGSAVAEFAMVSTMLVMLLLGVLQVGVYLHVRNVVAASAAEGARYAANADVEAAAGGPRATQIITGSLGPRAAAEVPCTSAVEAAAGGPDLVVVRCQGALPVFFAPLGRLLSVHVAGRALKEGR